MSHQVPKGTTLIDVLAALLCVPAAEPELLERLSDQPSTQHAESLRRWLVSALADDDSIATAGVDSCDGDGFYVDLHEPQRMRVGFFMVVQESDHDMIRSIAYECRIDHIVLLCCTREVERRLKAARVPATHSTIVGALWTAAILIENVRPMFWGLRPHTVATDAAHALSSYYSEDRPAVISNVSLGRSSDNYATALALNESVHSKIRFSVSGRRLLETGQRSLQQVSFHLLLIHLMQCGVSMLALALVKRCSTLYLRRSVHNTNYGRDR